MSHNANQALAPVLQTLTSHQLTPPQDDYPRELAATLGSDHLSPALDSSAHPPVVAVEPLQPLSARRQPAPAVLQSTSLFSRLPYCDVLLS